MISLLLQKSKRVLYTKKLKKNLNMTAIYKEDSFFLNFDSSQRFCMITIYKKNSDFFKRQFFSNIKEVLRSTYKKTYINER